MLSDNVRGALIMTAAMAAFIVSDTFLKVAFEELPVMQSVMVRNLVASLLLLALVWRAGVRLQLARSEWRVMGLRAVGEIGAVLTYMFALAQLPIADVSAVLQTVPLAVTMAAALFLREPVGWRRWSAILVGFGGVMLMVKPGTDGFEPAALLAVATVCFVTFRDVITRRLQPSTPGIVAASVTSVLVTLSLLLAMPFEGVAPMGAKHLATLTAAGVAIVGGYIAVVAAMRIGDVSAVAPFRYTVLVFALALGFVVFGDVPDRWTAVGAVLVVAAGLFTFWRERVRRAERAS